MPGAHKIGAAISGPRITGGNFMDTTLFLILTVATPRFVDRQGTLSAIPGLAVGGLGTHQVSQRKTKGQQPKGKIVSEFFTLFHNFSHFS